jgi:hypothetical protein
MSVKKANIKKLIAHLEQLPEEHFDLRYFIRCTPEDVLKSWGPEHHHGFNLNPKTLFRQYHEVPCGTTACVAGETWLQFADTDKQRAMTPVQFAAAFLGFDRPLVGQFFYNNLAGFKMFPKEPSLLFYGKHEGSVSTRDVVAKLRELL